LTDFERKHDVNRQYDATQNPDAFKDDFVLGLSSSIAQLRHDGRITHQEFKTIFNILYEVQS
jgi:hypothetical protein